MNNCKVMKKFFEKKINITKKNHFVLFVRLQQSAETYQSSAEWRMDQARSKDLEDRKCGGSPGNVSLLDSVAIMTE